MYLSCCLQFDLLDHYLALYRMPSFLDFLSIHSIRLLVSVAVLRTSPSFVQYSVLRNPRAHTTFAPLFAIIVYIFLSYSRILLFLYSDTIVNDEHFLLSMLAHFSAVVFD